MGTFQTSTGERLKKSVIDSRVKKAKKELKQIILDEYGYLFCDSCLRTRVPDCSHLISVNECQNSGRAELAYNPNNIILECRDCHMTTESQSHEVREQRYLDNC